MTQQETTYFKTDGMIPCPCGCGFTITDSRFWMKLDKAREIAGVPFTITSGARCLTYNRRIGSTDSSTHVDGLAVDIATIDSTSRFHVMRGLILAGFERIGYNAGKKFLHVDDDREKPRKLIFDY